MSEVIQLRTCGMFLILLVLVYTLHLVRSNRLSAHLAISWIIAELVFLILILSDNVWAYAKSLVGESAVLYGALLLGTVWIVFLMLDSLTRISSLTVKLKEVNQELALALQRLDCLEEKDRKGLL
ncbi:MAG: DUF2304 domain-containing protein [Nitrospirae bacterium]|nr:MAG: DUF2304 domain-containing protein [Nitrospirota bacterium]